MIDHFQIATMGLGPGHSIFNTATMGFGFVVEVVVQPVPTGGGGGGGSAWLSYPEEWRAKRRLVTVTVRQGKKKIWTVEKVVEIKSAEAIVTAVNFVNKVNNDIQVTLGNIKASHTAQVAANVFATVSKPIEVTVNAVQKVINPVVSKFKKDK